MKWTNGATGALGDSVVTEFAGGNIGIGTATPNNKLHVVGSVELGASAGGGVNPTIVNPNNIGSFAQSLSTPTVDWISMQALAYAHYRAAA